MAFAAAKPVQMRQKKLNAPQTVLPGKYRLGASLLLHLYKSDNMHTFGNEVDME